MLFWLNLASKNLLSCVVMTGCRVVLHRAAMDPRRGCLLSACRPSCDISMTCTLELAVCQVQSDTHWKCFGLCRRSKAAKSCSLGACGCCRGAEEAARCSARQLSEPDDQQQAQQRRAVLRPARQLPGVHLPPGAEAALWWSHVALPGVHVQVWLALCALLICAEVHVPGNQDLLGAVS